MRNAAMALCRLLLGASLLGVPQARAKLAADRLDTKAAVTPIQKVTSMLEAMIAKGKADKKAEEVTFAKFATWCTDMRRKTEREVKEGSDLMDKLDAQIQKAIVHMRQLSARVMELNEDVSRWKQDQGSASIVRTAEKQDYRATAADYSESLDALTNAIGVLQKQAYDRAQPEFVQAFLQVQNQRLVPPHAKKTLASFLQQTSVQEPAANAYEFQSGGVVDMLKKMKEEFRSKKSELDKEEMQAQHAYEMIVQQLTDNIEQAEKESSEKSGKKAEIAQRKAENEGNLESTRKERDEDQTYLDDTNALCNAKSSDFEKRQKLRAGELEALEEAVEIIGGDAVAGNADKHLPKLVQASQQADSWVQLRNGQRSPVQDRIAEFLSERAKASNSRLLYLVSEKVNADPFSKVKKMLKDLIVKLVEESVAETEHNGWCKTELATNKNTRDSKSTEVEQLTATIEDLTSIISSLADDLATLASEIQELDAGMVKATTERTESKEKNAATLKDAKEGQAAVTRAISVLKEFYAKAAEATSLTQEVQSPAEDAPETFDDTFQGDQTGSGNVLSFLEVILSDFARLEAETSNAETVEQEDYDKFMFESKKSKALKEKDKANKEETKVGKESELHSTQGDLKGTQDQLDKAMQYYEKLKPTCVDSGITYEERVKRREEEIQSLQESLQILSGEGI